MSTIIMNKRCYFNSFYVRFSLCFILSLRIVFMLGNKNSWQQVSTKKLVVPRVNVALTWDMMLNNSASVMYLNQSNICPGKDHDQWECSKLRCNTHVREPLIDISPQNNSQSPTRCKTLWFVGISQANLDRIGRVSDNLYSVLYAAALESVQLHSADVLQPVLMLNDFGNRSSNPEVSVFANFAKSRGTIVVRVDELSIQGTIDKLYPNPPEGHRIGPFMRMDIPNIIRDNKIFEIPGICGQYALYTDSDVLFPNPITHEDMRILKAGMGQSAIILYGRGFTTAPKMHNTGVMLIDVPKFEAELPAIIEFGEKKGTGFQAYDQGWINAYFRSRGKLRALLPLYWNWKIYWSLHPSDWKDLKLIHYHGPKPGRCLENIAHCDPKSSTCPQGSYLRLVRQGICCDHGRTAFLALDLTRQVIGEFSNFISS